MAISLKPSMFKPLARVRYIPRHAYGDKYHFDCEDGKVSSVNGLFVFVKFDKQVVKKGWDEAIAEACDPESLILL
jgi:hypothetical protein